VWRIWDTGEAHTQIKHRRIYKILHHYTSQGCIDFTGRDDPAGELETEEEEDTTSESLQKIAVSTGELLVFKVDIERQKLVELRSIGAHALFLGYNSAVCLSTMDFPAFQPNCAYLTDDCSEFGQIVRQDLGIWNFEKRSLQDLREAWPSLFPWLDESAPIWITPSLF
jgi:hypothetical protein